MKRRPVAETEGRLSLKRHSPPRAIRRDSPTEEKTGRLKWAQDGRCGGLRSEGNDGGDVGQIPPNKGKRRKGGRKFTVFDWTGLLYKRGGGEHLTLHFIALGGGGGNAESIVVGTPPAHNNARAKHIKEREKGTGQHSMHGQEQGGKNSRPEKLPSLHHLSLTSHHPTLPHS